MRETTPYLLYRAWSPEHDFILARLGYYEFAEIQHTVYVVVVDVSGGEDGKVIAIDVECPVNSQQAMSKRQQIVIATVAQAMQTFWIFGHMSLTLQWQP